MIHILGLNKLIKKLDKRWQNNRRQPSKKRVDGTFSENPMPKDAPHWSVSKSLGDRVI